MLSDRVLVRPEAFRESLIDHHDRLLFRQLVSGEVAARDQYDPDGLEVIRIENAAQVGGWLAAARRRVLSFEKVTRHTQPGQRQAIGKTGMLHTWRGRDFL